MGGRPSFWLSALYLAYFSLARCLHKILLAYVSRLDCGHVLIHVLVVTSLGPFYLSLLLVEESVGFSGDDYSMMYYPGFWLVGWLHG